MPYTALVTETFMNNSILLKSISIYLATVFILTGCSEPSVKNESCINDADTALYLAKDQGRNKVCIL